MSQNCDFYEARARQAADEARKATLDNVRERNLVAAKTWQNLADQARRVMENRIARAEGAAVVEGPGPDAAG